MSQALFHRAWSRLSVQPALPFGAYQCKHHDDFGAKSFADFDIFAGIRGYGSVEILGRTIELVAGRVILIPPRVEVRMWTDDREPALQAFCHFRCRVDGRLIRDCRNMVDEQSCSLHLPKLPPLALVADHDDGRIGRRLVNAYEHAGDDVAQLEAQVLLLSVFHLLRRTYAHAGSASRWDETTVHSAVQFMQQRVDQPLRLEEVAGHVGVSASTLGRLFRGHLRTTPMRYLMQLRLARARELLTATRMPIKQVGFACGFARPQMFSRAFTAAHGMSPRDYRNRHFGVS